MRPVPPLTLVTKNQSLLYPTLSTTATPTSTAACRSRPCSNSNHFEANGVAVLILLTCGLACALALSLAIRCFLRCSGSHIPNQQEVEQRKPSVEVAETSHTESLVLVYSAAAGAGTGMKQLAGQEVECVICLSEFVEGDVIQVLGSCKHGFHVSCIRKWLSSHYSCPTCRCRTTTTTCLPSSQSLQEAQAHSQEVAGA